MDKFTGFVKSLLLDCFNSDSWMSCCVKTINSHLCFLSSLVHFNVLWASLINFLHFSFDVTLFHSSYCCHELIWLWWCQLKQITFRRTQGKLPFWHKVKFLCAVFVQILFSSSSKSFDTMVSSKFPSLFPTNSILILQPQKLLKIAKCGWQSIVSLFSDKRLGWC